LDKKTYLRVGCTKDVLSLSFKHVKKKKAKWDDDSCYSIERHYVITAEHYEHGSISFDYWTSVAKPELEHGVDLMEAFECFVSDAISASHHAYEEFCSEFGYNPELERSRETYNECLVSLNNFNDLFGGEVFVYDYYHELTEYLNGIRGAFDKEKLKEQEEKLKTEEEIRKTIDEVYTTQGLLSMIEGKGKPEPKKRMLLQIASIL
jgi:hypothetical protein